MLCMLMNNKDLFDLIRFDTWTIKYSDPITAKQANRRLVRTASTLADWIDEAQPWLYPDSETARPAWHLLISSGQVWS